MPAPRSALPPADARFFEAVSKVVYANPFSTARIDAERDALGRCYVEREVDWNRRATHASDDANVAALIERTHKAIERVRARLTQGAALTTEQAELYEDAVLFDLYHRCCEPFDGLIHTLTQGQVKQADALIAEHYPRFADDAAAYLAIDTLKLPYGFDPAHLYASFFQIRRAFHHIFRNILGSSQPASRLRQAVWQSIFTYDLRRYRRVLYHRMGEVATLITGPSGTGKELVARAIGLSRYIPFNPNPRKMCFTDDFAGSFHPLNLTALSPTLIESELFGHRRGAFTGAVADRAGWLEVCRPLGTVFLDEIGDLDASIQVKLLRVLQTRTFQRLGDTADRTFAGKIITATNRDVGALMRDGRFRDDFYYRLCSDQVIAPSLREQLADRPEDRRLLVLHITRWLVGGEAEALADEVERWVDENLGATYAWPGNVRELEQCVRNIMIRREYHPTPAPGKGGGGEVIDRFTQDVTSGSLTADALLGRYCTLVYARTGSYVEAAERLGLDRRTVKARIDTDWLRELQGRLPV